MPLLEALLDAFEEDTRHAGYADRAALLQYCSRSANPIGRLLLHLHGIDDPALLAQSDAVCSALQLINFWQDLSVDVPRGRLYVPRSDAAAHATTTALACARGSPRGRVARARARPVRLGERADDWPARPSPWPFPGGSAGSFGSSCRAVSEFLRKSAAMNFASFARRPRLHVADQLLIGVRALTMRPSLPEHTRIA